MLKMRFLPLAMLALSSPGFAADLPSAGSQLQQIPTLPEPPRPAPDIRIQKPQGAAVLPDDGTRITVQTLRVSGAEMFTPDELLQASGFVPGTALTLAELRAMAGRIAAHVQARGYFLAQAYLPAQESRDGTITVAVLPGQYDQVQVNNRSTLSDAQLQAIVQGLVGQPVELAPLERRLLLLSDLPGTRVQSTLAPGASLGMTRLVLDVEPGERITGSVDADNTGSRYTGRERVGATVNLNNPAGYGDVASLRGFTSADGLHYARASYQGQWGAAKLGAAYAHLEYRLGKEFGVLDAKGSAKVATLYGSYALIRSRQHNLYAQASFDAKRFVDRADATGTRTDKHAQLFTLNLNGNRRDALGGGGMSSYALDWVVGQIDIRTPDARLIDALTVRSQGSFHKLTASLSRLQALSASTQLYGALNGQWASKNLDVSEKMGLGGMGGVRAYPSGEAYGDDGLLASVELRHSVPLPEWAPSGRLQVLGFYDIGSVRLNHRPYTSADNRRTLSGAGVGLDWLGANSLALKLYYARKTGREDATSAPDRSGRLWLQAVKAF